MVLTVTKFFGSRPQHFCSLFLPNPDTTFHFSSAVVILNPFLFLWNWWFQFSHFETINCSLNNILCYPTSFLSPLPSATFLEERCSLFQVCNLSLLPYIKKNLICCLFIFWFYPSLNLLLDIQIIYLYVSSSLCKPPFYCDVLRALSPLLS